MENHHRLAGRRHPKPSRTPDRRQRKRHSRPSALAPCEKTGAGFRPPLALCEAKEMEKCSGDKEKRGRASRSAGNR